MSNKLRVLVLSIAALICGAAQAADVDLTQPPPKVAARTPLPAGSVKTDLVVKMTTWRSAVLVNDIVGRRERGLFCTDPVSLRYAKSWDDWLVAGLSKAFREQAVVLGINSPEETKSVFESKDGGGADLRVGATLVAFDYRTCGREDLKGDAYAKVKWEVFSTRRQRVVYTTVVEASSSVASALPAKAFEKAFLQSVVGNFLADPKFIALVRAGGDAEGDAEPARQFASLQLDPGTLAPGGVGKSAPRLLEAVVTVESGVGLGSGFYISRDGYLLTNQHVVADAKFVRIRLADGRSLVGEVVRSDKQRDVALLRTDPVATSVLVLRREESRVGEEVYAMGSPFGAVLSGTLTRGVLSARRVFEGVAYLQSDAAINPGNSGGPLIDAEGQVMGIARLGSNSSGLNLFIPIDDALDKLSLSMRPSAAPAQAK